VNACLAFALEHGTGIPAARASLALATPEPAGAWAAMTALESGAHDDALALLYELVAVGRRRFKQPAGAAFIDISGIPEISSAP
jgi:hypothetical protein